jgi:hypothetical protein
VRDWVDWHGGYDDPSSSLSSRLEFVKLRLREAIDECPPGPVRLLSLCAGQGRDVIGVLPAHRRRDDVRALLVEYDGRNVELARHRAAEAGLAQVRIRQADASQVGSFADALPADVLLLCGIFGNISDRDIQRTVYAASALCAPGATVIWTRHRRLPDLTPAIREWFAECGFSEVAFDELDTGRLVSVGTHRLAGGQDEPKEPVLPAGPLFTFRDEDDQPGQP